MPPTFSRPVVVVLCGPTGGGKSAVGNRLSHERGGAARPFREAAGVNSQPTDPIGHEVGGMVFVDGPGLLDSAGQDGQHTHAIVTDMRARGYLNALLFVLNEHMPRFDGALQAVVKLLVDSFGPRCLEHMGLVFTRATGTCTPEQARSKAADIAAIISQRTGFPLAFLPCWQVDCHPEQLEGRMYPAVIEQVRDASRTAVRDILSWAQALPAMDTTAAVVGEYEEQRRRREAEAAAEAARAEAVASAARADAAHSARCTAEAAAAEQLQVATDALHRLKVTQLDCDERIARAEEMTRRAMLARPGQGEGIQVCLNINVP
eukprot:EG_transcript_15807